MIETKTLLILGAGASVPYGYPTGQELREELCNLNMLKDLYILNPEYSNRIIVHERGVELFCQAFKASQIFSIDAFLAKRGNEDIGKQPSGIHNTFGSYETCGKSAIACRLIERETHTPHLPEPTDDHWLQYLWNLMNDAPASKFKDNQLKIISFNYDRVIEQYFQTVIKNLYGVNNDEATDLRKSIEIIHVYGNLQDLEDRPYGEKPNDFSKVADCIKVIPEAREADDQLFEKAKEMIGWANKICFIGFGFDSTNVRRLGFPDHNLSAKLIFSTQYGMTVSEALAKQQLLGGRFVDNFTQNTNIKDFKTLEYIRHAGVFLSF